MLAIETSATSPSAVSGYYFSHPESTYFGVAEIGRDQAQENAARKGMTLEEAEKWLAPNLGYDPEDSQRTGIDLALGASRPRPARSSAMCASWSVP